MGRTLDRNAPFWTVILLLVELLLMVTSVSIVVFLKRCDNRSVLRRLLLALFAMRNIFCGSVQTAHGA